jgi:hypothetical protein
VTNATGAAWSWRRVDGFIAVHEVRESRGQLFYASFRLHWEKKWPTGGELREQLFHAYDVNDYAACTTLLWLATSVEEPNEGSSLCLACLAMIRRLPLGREPGFGGLI